MSQEPELDAMRAAWAAPARQTESAGDRSTSPARLRGFRIRSVCELAFGVVVIAFALAFAGAHRDFETILWAAVVCVTTVAAGAYQIWNWRGSWKSAGKSVADYSDLYERRCRAMMRAARFGLRFLALQLAIAVPWLTLDVVRGQMSVRRYALAMGILTLLVAVFVFSFRRMRRRAGYELEGVEAFRRRLVE
jgi:hypothetical protein